MKIALQVIQIILSITLIAIILIQAKGGGLSSVFGGSGSIYRTKRGAEKVMYQATIILAIVFFVVSIVVVMLPG